MNYWGEKTWKQLFIWLLLWDNLWRLEVFNSEEKEKFFLLIFFYIYITIIFQEISDVVSALRFLPVTDLDPQATTWRKQSE